MFPLRIIMTAGLAAVIVAGTGYGQIATLPSPVRGTPYAQMRTWHEQSLLLQPTQAERLEMLRTLVRAGPLGQRGLERMFQNLEGAGVFDPTIPGVEKNLRLTASWNLNVSKGAARNHVYAVRVARDPSFRLLAVDWPLFDPAGRMLTDKDLLFQHRPTGTRCRIESKDVQPESQRRALAHYQTQIDKMAAEYRRTGELQAFVNRRAVVPELKDYARRQGVPVYENVVTSERNLGAGQTRFDAVLADMRRQATIRASLKLWQGGAQAGLGVAVLAEAIPALCEDFAGGADADASSETPWVRTAQHGALAAGGGLMMTSGTIGLGSRFSPAVAGGSRWMALGRWSGRAGAAAVVAADAFVVWQYQQGWLTPRQFWSAQSGFAGGIVGGGVGGWAGAKSGALAGGAVGAFFGPEGIPIGAAIGGFLGGVGGAYGGGYLGSTWASHATASYYLFKDQDTERRFVEFLGAYYGG